MSERDLFIKWADAAGLNLYPGRFCEFLLADTAAAYRAWQARADIAAQREAELVAEVERLRDAIREVKSHERDESKGVLCLGLRDNDQSRQSLDRLFSLALTKEEEG